MRVGVKRTKLEVKIYWSPGSIRIWRYVELKERGTKD